MSKIKILILFLQLLNSLMSQNKIISCNKLKRKFKRYEFINKISNKYLVVYNLHQSHYKIYVLIFVQIFKEKSFMHIEILDKIKLPIILRFNIFKTWLKNKDLIVSFMKRIQRIFFWILVQLLFQHKVYGSFMNRSNLVLSRFFN